MNTESTYYTRPEGVMGGPCLHCSASQPEHIGLTCDEVREKRATRLANKLKPSEPREAHENAEASNERNALLEKAVNFLRSFQGAHHPEALAIDELRIENVRLQRASQQRIQCCEQTYEQGKGDGLLEREELREKVERLEREVTRLTKVEDAVLSGLRSPVETTESECLCPCRDTWADETARAMVAAKCRCHCHKQPAAEKSVACGCGPNLCAYLLACEPENGGVCRRSEKSIAQPTGDGWVDNAEYLLNHCPFTIRVREGGGPENLLSSLVVTFQGMQAKLAKSEDPGVAHPNCNYLAPSGGVCNKCGWIAANPSIDQARAAKANLLPMLPPYASVGLTKIDGNHALIVNLRYVSIEVLPTEIDGVQVRYKVVGEVTAQPFLCPNCERKSCICVEPPDCMQCGGVMLDGQVIHGPRCPELADNRVSTTCNHPAYARDITFCRICGATVN